jgi:uncharacterized protein DUF3291
MPPGHHLAQINIARMRAPIDDPMMASFRRQLDEINAAAEQSHGFIWRLQDDSGNATAIRAFEDPLLLVNMSVWRDLESLQDYTYRGSHLGVLRDRKHWFEKMDGPTIALWWVPEGHTPTVDEGKLHIALIMKNGPTAASFTFQQLFDPPAAS